MLFIVFGFLLTSQVRDDCQETFSNISNKNSFVIKWPEAFIVVYQKN